MLFCNRRATSHVAGLTYRDARFAICALGLAAVAHGLVSGVNARNLQISGSLPDKANSRPVIEPQQPSAIAVGTFRRAGGLHETSRNRNTAQFRWSRGGRTG
jgi:hypothetical protein